jgi:hypothetical protein
MDGGGLMKVFKDNLDRDWAVSVDVAAIKRVRSMVDVDLLEAVGGDLLEKLSGDPVLLCDVIWALVQPQAGSRNVTDEDFGQSMGGDALENATDALLEELTAFFPSPRRRVLAKALGKLKSFEAKAISLAEKKLEGPELDAALEKALSSLEGSYGKPPASVESIPPG